MYVCKKIRCKETTSLLSSQQSVKWYNIHIIYVLVLVRTISHSQCFETHRMLYAIKKIIYLFSSVSISRLLLYFLCFSSSLLLYCVRLDMLWWSRPSYCASLFYKRYKCTIWFALIFPASETSIVFSDSLLLRNTIMTFNRDFNIQNVWTACACPMPNGHIIIRYFRNNNHKLFCTACRHWFSLKT